MESFTLAHAGTNWDLIFGVDSVTGEERWHYETGSGAMGFLTASDGVICAFFDRGDVVALRSEIGGEKSEE